jgi:hypothetical protein
MLGSSPLLEPHSTGPSAAITTGAKLNAGPEPLTIVGKVTTTTISLAVGITDNSVTPRRSAPAQTPPVQGRQTGSVNLAGVTPINGVAPWTARYKRDDGSITELGPVAAEDLIGLSDHAIRAGYIGLAEWIVKGRAARQAVKRAHLGEAA